MENVFLEESNEKFEQVVQEILNSLYYSQTKSLLDFSQETIASAKEDVKILVSDHDFDITKITEVLHKKPWDRERIQYFTNLLEKSKSDIIYSSLIHHNSKFGDTLHEFDWFYKLVFGTNDLNTLRYPMLQLKLSTVNDSGGQSKLLFEVRKNMLLRMIQCLELVLNE